MMKLIHKGTDLCRSLIKFGFYKLLYFTHLNVTGICRTSKNFSLKIYGGNSNVSLNNINARSNLSILVENGNLNIGKNVFFNNNCSINCLYKISIGDDTIMGENVKLYDHNHKYTNKNMLIKDQGYIYGEIHIGENCWIASDVTILKGVTIGDNVVIGAGCTIYKDVASNHIIYNKQNLIQKVIP